MRESSASPDAIRAEQLGADLRQALGALNDCRLVPVGTLPRPELKSKRLRRVIEEII